MKTLFIMYIASGLLVTLLGFPLLFKKVKPNPFYGFRTEKTLSDPEIWYAVNRHAAIRLIIAGSTFLITALILYFWPGITVDVYAILCAVVFLIVMTIGVFQSVKYLSTLG